MKKLVKRVTALGLAAAMSTALCLNASARAASEDFTGEEGYKLTFRLNVITRNVGGNGPYQLTVNASENHDKPYFYPKLYIKGVLFVPGNENDVVEKTFDNAYYGTVVSGTKSTSVCDGMGYGYFDAYGNNTYGRVYGYLYN